MDADFDETDFKYDGWFRRAMKAVFGPGAFLFFGVLLPVAALVVELTTGMCADVLSVDPVPTWYYAVMIALVPVTLAAWGFNRKKGANSPAWRAAVGLATGVSLVYAIPFAPIVPFALLAAFFGIGLLPLAPLGSAITGFVVLRKQSKAAHNEGWWGTAGIVAGLLVMTAFAYPSMRIDMAAEDLDEGPEARAEAIETMREINPELVEDRLCNYRRKTHPNPITPIANMIDGINIYQHSGSTYPEAYWQVTGRACPDDFWSRGTRTIAGMEEPEGLVFGSSRLDSSVDTAAATAYTEWLFTVRNTTDRQREADFIVQLPPGAVASRVTLWVNGEPREATFAGRGQAEKAYETVVARSRDPILVTSVAPDRIRVRMFPVPAQGTMKARIGVSQPLELENDGNSRMQFPHVISGNLDTSLTHAVWVEAKHSISTARLEGFVEREKDGVFQVRGKVAQSELGDFEVDMIRQPVSQVFARDGQRWVVQRAELMEKEKDEELIVVLDGGARMAEHAEGLGEAMAQIGARKLTLIVAGDRVEIPVDGKGARIGWHWPEAREFVEEWEFEGGRDNAPALEAAIERAVDRDATIVWIHAAQEVMLSDLLGLPERDRVKIHELQVDDERGILVDELHARGMLTAIPRRGTAAEDLGRWLSRRSRPIRSFDCSHKSVEASRRCSEKLVEERAKIWRTTREFVHIAPEHGKETSRHLARIAANERVFELMRAGEHDAAVEMAANYQIVTPVSAAIVLETQEQYDEFGLERSTGGGVPSIPEPEEWALMIIGTLALMGAMYRRRQEQSGVQMAGA